MEKKGKISRFYSFSFLFLIAMIAIIITFIALLSVISYSETSHNLEKTWKISNLNAERHLSDSIILVSDGLRLFELTYDSHLKQAFIPFLQAYNQSKGNPEQIDLEYIRRALPPAVASKIDLYIINEDGIVINATFISDIGLDFKQWPSIYQNITDIRLGDSFRSDRAVIGFNPDKQIRKFAYLPTPDHQYLLELSITVDEYTEDRAEFSFYSVGDSISQMYPGIRSVSLYDALIRPIGNDETPIAALDNRTKEIIQNVFTSHKPIEIHDSFNHSTKKFIFIPVGRNETVTDNLLDIVALINYDTSDYESNQKSTFYYHLLIAVVSAILGIILVYILTRYLTGPISRIIEDIDIIAKGDLDHPIHHTGSPEFKRLEGSINLLIESLKSLITSLREKEVHLVASEQRYRSLIEHQTDLILRFDNQGNILFTNDEFNRFFGLQQDINRSHNDRESGTYNREISAFIQSLKEENVTPIIDHRITLPNGQERWIQWSNSVILDQEDNIIEYQAVGRDISYRKRTEIALRESEEKYRTLISNLPDFVIVHQNSQIIFANEAIALILGYSTDELIGTSIYDYLLENESPRVIESIRRRMMGETVADYEIHIRDKIGGLRTVIVRASPISYNNAPAVLTVLTDITERKLAEKKVLEGELRYRRLIEQLNEGIWITDENSITTYTNTKMQEILGYERDEILGKSFFSFVSPDDIYFLQEKKNNREQGLSERYSITFFTKEGIKIFTEVSATPSTDSNGNYSGSIVLVSDITQRKINEQQIKEYTQELEQKNRELEDLRDQLFIINKDLDRIVHERTKQVMSLIRQKDEFIMRLGHDLRTPLTPILGLLPDLIQDVNSDLDHQVLRIIEQNAKCIHDIAHKSLTLAKMNSFNINPEIEPVDVRSAILHLIRMYEGDLHKAGIITRINIPKDLIIGVDKILFQELIENILSNGIKYIQRNDGQIAISAGSDGDQVTIRIEDNGIGLRAEEIEKVFEEFYKSDRSRHDKSSTGLGLAICRKIVENHGGSIYAESSGPGEGTSFIITLPIWLSKYE